MRRRPVGKAVWPALQRRPAPPPEGDGGSRAATVGHEHDGRGRSGRGTAVRAERAAVNKASLLSQLHIDRGDERRAEPDRPFPWWILGIAAAALAAAAVAWF